MAMNPDVPSPDVTPESLLGPLPSNLEELNALFDTLNASGERGLTLSETKNLAPSELEALYDKVLVQCGEAQWAQASRVALHLAMHAPRNPRFLFLAATCMQRMHEFQAAAGLFGLSLMEQEQPIIAFRLAECLAASGESEQAHDAFEACIDMCRTDFEHRDLQDACEAALVTLAAL